MSPEEYQSGIEDLLSDKREFSRERYNYDPIDVCYPYFTGYRFGKFYFTETPKMKKLVKERPGLAILPIMILDTIDTVFRGGCYALVDVVSNLGDKVGDVVQFQKLINKSQKIGDENLKEKVKIVSYNFFDEFSLFLYEFNEF